MAVPGAGARAPGPSQAREPASRRNWVPPLPLQRPLPPPPPPQSQARPPRTCAKRHRRVPGRGTDPGGGTGTWLHPPSVAGGRGGVQGGEGRGKGRGGSRAGPGPGEEGPGARATRAPPLPSPGCAQAGVAGPLDPRPQTVHAPALTRLPAPPIPPTYPPLRCPQPLCCPELQIPKCDKHSVAEPLRSEHALGTPGHQRASESSGEPLAQQSPGFHPQEFPTPQFTTPSPTPSPSGA